MGVKPAQVADLLALKGDAIDNIPGAPGIGDKGARDLILRFGSVEAALDHAAEVERKMYRESLQNNRDRILLSKKLATIDTTCRSSSRWSAVQAQAARPRRAEAGLQGAGVLQPDQGTRSDRGRAHARLPDARFRRSCWKRGLRRFPPDAPVADQRCRARRGIARRHHGGLRATKPARAAPSPIDVLREALRHALLDVRPPQDRARRKVTCRSNWLRTWASRRADLRTT